MAKKIDILSIILIFFIIFISYKIYLEIPMFHLTCIKSELDDNEYCVRDRDSVDIEKSANRLARVTKKCKQLIKHLNDVNPNSQITQLLNSGYNPKRIEEILPSSEHTAYSENKGEKIAFCLHTQRNGKKKIDDNTLLFVALHELSHVATDEIGHTPKYWQNFKTILEYAVDLGIYEPVDYKKNPVIYCGMEITDNPYYDL
tara:strand:- start:1 stop:603 length:603 start_codon:yes stop_codon:yes gene_type:complete